MPSNKSVVAARRIKPAYTNKRSKYAKARVSAGLTYDKLRAMGWGMGTIQKADNGRLPVRRRDRAAYLAAIGLTERVAS
jgi:hypothetical protein